MLNIDLTGRRALVAGVADDGGFGFAIAKALAEAGSELVRVTVNTSAAAHAVPLIRDRLAALGCTVPLIGDFHYNGHKLLTESPACAEALAKYRIKVGDVTFSGQSLLVLLFSVMLIGVLYLFFDRTLYGKALRATALNRIGARLVGVSPNLAGSLTFTLAALLCAFSGVLIGPITTIYYDSGFLISLKGFVGAIIGGLSSYPLAAAGSVLVGLLESFSSFWASAFKEVIVFTLIIPVLLWRSLTTHHHEEDE